ncbi:MAG TPA: response regulator [Candidatus Wunengus sp. YC61]|uniref:response regulator n=1 Tax=Candidatus Wunengus sp. YC61 TaxID=3367698 RepID=UPI004027B892
MATILVVENDKNHLFLIEQELLIEGYNIVTAKDGCEALKKAIEYPPDLVVMDIIFPDMDCIELIERIICRNRKIPIIIHTSYTSYKCKLITWLTVAYVIIKSSDLSGLKNKIRELTNKIE